MNESFSFRNSRLPRKECRKVPCDARILRIRQPHLRQTCPPRRTRQFGDTDPGYEAVDQDAGKIVACEFRLDRASHQSRTAAGN